MRCSKFNPSASFFLFMLLAPPAHALCQSVEFLAPRAAVVTEGRPLIEWSPMADAEHYRVRVVSRVPEGEVVATIETNTRETRFQVPQPLAEYKSRARVAVTTHCKDGTEATLEKVFSVDVSGNCRIAPKISARREDNGWLLSWPVGAGASTYDVLVFAALDGRVLERTQVAGANARIARQSGTPAVAAIRPRCGSNVGELVYRWLPD